MWALRLFGRFTLLSLEHYELEEEAPEGITGGSSQNFEIDTAPLAPEDRFIWEEDSFGFRR